MKKHHDCKEVVENFRLLLDGELNAKQEQETLCELQRCIHCLEEYNLEKRYTEFIKERYDKKTISPEFLEKLKGCCNDDIN